MTALDPAVIRILTGPRRRLRVLLALVLIAVLASMPLPMAGAFLWTAAAAYMTLAETMARMLCEQQRVRRQHEADCEGQAAQLAGRDARIAHLERELAVARAAARRATDMTGDPAFRRVGLSPSAPDWLVQAARTAYRRRLHPDVHLPHHQRRAHDRFIRAEEAFEQIARLRG